MPSHTTKAHNDLVDDRYFVRGHHPGLLEEVTIREPAADLFITLDGFPFRNP
jgi:hypothetical protein